MPRVWFGAASGAGSKHVLPGLWCSSSFLHGCAARRGWDVLDDDPLGYGGLTIGVPGPAVQLRQMITCQVRAVPISCSALHESDAPFPAQPGLPCVAPGEIPAEVPRVLQKRLEARESTLS